MRLGGNPITPQARAQCWPADIAQARRFNSALRASLEGYSDADVFARLQQLRTRRDQNDCHARRPGFALLRQVSPTGGVQHMRRAGGLKRGDAGLGAGRHFAATGTAMPGIFTFTAPRWLRLVM
jgi:hypothetical protein